MGFASLITFVTAAAALSPKGAAEIHHVPTVQSTLATDGLLLLLLVCGCCFCIITLRCF